MSPIHTAYLQLKYAIHGHPVLFPWIQQLRGADYGTFCSAEDNLCIEGFQSSANSFLYNVFRVLRPDLEIAHHTHSIANLRRALSFDVPALVVFRDPADAIPSMSARFHPALEASVYRYLHFYRFVLDHADDLILTSFEEVTENFPVTVRRVERQAKIPFGTYDAEDVRQRTIQHIRNWSKRQDKEEQISLPRWEREKRKATLRSRLPEVDRFDEARVVHQRLQRLLDDRNES
jgi:hypothetical protein